MKLLKALFLGLACLTGASAIKVGDKVPKNVDLHFGFPPEKINFDERVPGYLAKEDALKKLGVDEIIIYCVNDGAVMDAWASDQGVAKTSIIKLMGDPYGELTEKLDMELTHAGPKSVGLINRCKRFALFIEDGKVKIVKVAEAEDDPAGDERPDVTLAESMIDAISALGKDEL
ncbi:unnamed protein product [Cylindrotheca closterium]|uniref:Redoxin domain-containing protein n=1 Tax=Cylindrotheca closterium TaxID=2856 RepID=A0AAD2PUF3_9STRA|nr:unnamed protein product [Cylindrotheca closterium]